MKTKVDSENNAKNRPKFTQFDKKKCQHVCYQEDIRPGNLYGDELCKFKDENEEIIKHCKISLLF